MSQKVITGNHCSSSGSPNGGGAHGILSGPKYFFSVH